LGSQAEQEVKMKTRVTSKVLLAPVVLGLLMTALLSRGADKTVLRGWLSDESCASGRASSGTYTGTNPNCARKCVKEGKKIVLVDPDHKRLLTIANQNAARERVGDYVEINGELDQQTKSLHIDSLKLLEKGSAMCDVPKKKKT
jgi:hypothetical protein